MMPRPDRDPEENAAAHRTVRAAVGEKLRTYYGVTLRLPMSKKLITVVEYLERVEAQQTNSS